MQQSLKAVLRLRELILEARLSPGERLSEPVLVERLGVSRTPVRSALAKLEHEGLVESLPNGGYRVAVFREQDAYDAIELRGTFEGLAARMAAEAAPGDDALADLRDCLKTLDGVVRRKRLDIDDFQRYMAANESFHGMIADLAGSEVLNRSLERIVALPFASASSFLMAQAELPESHEILFIAQHQHRCLIDAIAAGEGTRAEEIAREHARIAKQNLRVVLDNRKAMARVPALKLIQRAAER
jgi:GntR family transcriptional regulator, vanillate catabolism transcriptional regulator